MTLDIETKTPWTLTGAACWGGVLGAVAVMVHELYTGISGRCPEVEPFTHVMAELAVFVPGGAAAFAATGHIWSRIVPGRYP